MNTYYHIPSLPDYNYKYGGLVRTSQVLLLQEDLKHKAKINYS